MELSPIPIQDSTAMTWNKRDGEFAYCIEWEDLPKKTVVVPHACRALLFQKEKLSKIFEPGVYHLGKDSSLFSSLLGKKATRSRIVFVDTTDVDQSYIFKNIRCQENFCFDVSLALSIKIVQPALFFIHMMREKSCYHLANLKSAFFDEIRDAISEFFKPLAMAEIQQSRDFKNQLEQYIGRHIQNSLARSGFQLIQIRSLHYDSPQFQQIRNQEADHHMSVAQMDLQKRKEIVGIRMGDEVAEARDRSQIHSMMREQEKQKVQRSWCQEQELQQQGYEFKYKQSGIEQRYTLENMAMQYEQQNARQSQSHQIDLERERLQAEMSKQRIKAQMEQEINDIMLETQRKRAEAALELQRKKFSNQTEMEAWRQSFLNSIPKV